MKLKLITPPALEPVSLDDARQHIRSNDTDDNLLGIYIQAAREHVENLCGPLITQTWEGYLDDWPSGGVIEIQKARVLSVASIKYTDEGGVVTTLATSKYTADLVDGYHPRVVLKDTESWPTVELFHVNPIVVQFAAGFGPAAADVPAMLRQAIEILACYQYENRGDGNPIGTVVPVPDRLIDAFTSNYRVWGF